MCRSKIAWRNLGTMARIVLLVVAPAQALIAIVEISAIPNYRPSAGILPSTGHQSIERDQLWTVVAATLVALLIGFLASEFATGACFRAIAETYLGYETDWRASLGFAARRFLSILWIVTLGGVLTGIGFLACGVPGLYLWVGFAVALPVLMSEGQRGRKALGRSRALVQGRWWKTFGTLVVAGLLAAIVGGVVSGLIRALSFASGNDTVALFFITAVAGTAGALVATPFSAAYHTVLYFDLRVRKEAFDLRLLASRHRSRAATRVGAAAGAAAAAHRTTPFWPPPPGWQPPPETFPPPAQPPSRPPTPPTEP